MLNSLYLLPYLVVPLISARVHLISTRVSAHWQAILFKYMYVDEMIVNVNDTETILIKSFELTGGG